MGLRVSGKNLDIGEALRERVVGRVEAAVGESFQGRYTGHVTVSKDGYGFRADVNLSLASGTMVHSEGFADDAYIACDQAMEKLGKRLRRYKQRLRDHHHGQGNGGTLSATTEEVASYVIAAPVHDEDEEAIGDHNPVIIAEASETLKRLSVSAAVTELDLTGVPVLVFRHGGHGRVNVVYRRKDGNIGWVDPPAASEDNG
jgi:ribosomal subunit interface protein